MKQAILQFDHCEIGPIGQSILKDFTWAILPGETWVITGPNGSGKSALASAIRGDLPISTPHANSIFYNKFSQSTELLSFDRQQAIILNEFRNDESDFVEGGVDAGTKARNFILGSVNAQTANPEFIELCLKLNINHLLERGIKYLSTGEIRKVLLCRDLLKQPDLLVLDELSEGLDSQTRQIVSDRLANMLEKGHPAIIIVSDRYQDIPPQASHVLCLDAGKISFCGQRRDFESSPAYRSHFAQTKNLTDKSDLEALWETDSQFQGNLVEMANVSVAWDGRLVLEKFDWVLRPGDHSLIRGPNGCGKTTLLKLITGDNPQVYANTVSVLGMRRGSGESIWDIKSKLGFVSYQFHLDYLYYGYATLEETLLSGFQDSIGLYENPSYRQLHKVGLWLDALGMSAKRDWRFTQLSYGEQRAALVARAAIKSPPVLILDEPCHGLDLEQRRRVLDIADFIGTNTASTIVYVTHDPAEELDCTKRILDFYPNNQVEIVNAMGYLPARFRYEWRQV